MQTVHEKTLLFAEFIASDTRHWIRFVPALPAQAAYYYDAHLGGGILHRFLLHLTKQGSPHQPSCRVVLEVGSHASSERGLMFDVASTAREIPIELSGLSFAAAKWPARMDLLVRKAQRIAVTCADKYGPPPPTMPVYVH